MFTSGKPRIVESVGEGVTDLKPGDHVLPVFTGECKECRHCKSEDSNMCDLLRINTDRGVMLSDGKSRSWCHIECCKTNERVHGGNFWIRSCWSCSRRRGKIAAKKFGVTEFMNPKEHDKPVQEVIAEMTDGGVDQSVECTGSVNAMISAFECVHDGWGVAVLVGVPKKEDTFKTHPMNFLNEKTLKGTFFGNYKPRSDLPSVVEKYVNKELELEKFITHEVPFSEINKAFDYMLKGDGLRCIICMDAKRRWSATHNPLDGCLETDSIKDGQVPECGKKLTRRIKIK